MKKLKNRENQKTSVFKFLWLLGLTTIGINQKTARCTPRGPLD